MKWQNMVPTAVALLGVLLVSGGCEEGQVTETVNRGVEQVKKTVNQGVETVRETANLAGNIEITIDQPVRVKRCDARLITLPNRPSILQVTSYSAPDAESFPSVFLRAETQAKTPLELSGKTLRAQLYIQHVADGPVWHTPGDQPVELVISEASGDGFSAELRGGKLVNSHSDEEIDGAVGVLAAQF